MGPQVPSAPSALWALGCLALLLWLWVLCTACHRYVHPLPRCHVNPGSVLRPEGAGLGQALLGPEAGAPPPLLPHGPDDPLASRKAARRQQARLQGWGMPAEAVSARLSRGQGGADRGPTSLPCPQSLLRRPHLCSLSKSDTRLHELHQGRGGCTGKPSQEARAVGGFAALHPPNPSDLCPDPTTPSPTACQHGSPVPAVS
ncbi:Lck-interacting transmembrane adapter 1 [Pteropus alecto]|uniref:Lck-interacting transmembrane adapter 1 n=1 Tax=Pteropus alecto TaxID=9402 RepID=L5K1S2_PTEAL|nr:Lck-interacting transmembrane adapter 1 [Pteropus alecto]